MKAERGRQAAIMSLPHSFKAMVVSETPDKKFVREVEQKSLSQLPANEVLIEVQYSSLNYKERAVGDGEQGRDPELSSHAWNRCCRGGHGKLEPGI